MTDLHDLTNKVKDTADDVKHDAQDATQHLRDKAMEEKGRVEQGADDMKADMHDDSVMGNPGGQHDSIANTSDRQ